MKKLNIIMICIIVALVSGIIGYIIGINMKVDNNTYVSEDANIPSQSIEEKVVGTYYTTTWNGHEGVLTLYADGTCDYPTGSKGIWSVEDNTIHLDLDVSLDMLEFYNKNAQESSLINGRDRHDAIIVNSGIILHDKFFQKMN